MKKTKKVIKKKKRLLVCIILVILLITSVLLIIRFTTKNKKNVIDYKFESRVNKLENFNAGDYYKVGWLQVQGTHIDLPIIFSLNGYDVDYSFGWQSPTYQTDENREVLIGHNILNISSEPLLPSEELRDFEELMTFVYYDFAKDNLYLQYTKDGKDEIYLIYAVGFNDYYYDEATGYTDKKDIEKYIKQAKKNSIYKYDINVNADDEIIQIKTCTRYFGLDKNQQFMIEARKLRDGEEMIKYEVQKTKKYDELKLGEQNI